MRNSPQFYLGKNFRCAYTVYTSSNSLPQTSAMVLIHPIGVGLFAKDTCKLMVHLKILVYVHKKIDRHVIDECKQNKLLFKFTEVKNYESI